MSWSSAKNHHYNMKDPGCIFVLLAKILPGIKGVFCAPVPTMLEGSVAQSRGPPEGAYGSRGSLLPKAGMRAEVAW